jgi:anhydro-N-acetylmuramic acid kinase
VSGRSSRVIGLMSGTSLDGVDAAFVVTDGENLVEPGPALTVPYDDALRAALRSVLGGTGDVARVERALTEAHAGAVTELRRRGVGDVVDLIGFHGHTILHRPDQRRTWQIGDGRLLAELTGIDVIGDFRSADVAAGGEGAPLAPLYHAAMATKLPKPLAVLNIGGVANVTWIGEDGGALLAFDTGPGNALLDDWVLRHTGQAYDRDGVLARAGRADEAFVARFLAHAYFDRAPPKSLDRDDFAAFIPADLSAADGAATLTAMTVGAAHKAAAHFPVPPRRWLVTGGGRHNAKLMAALADALGVEVAAVEQVGWDGDALEAQAFAYLAARSVLGLPLSVPGTTGVPRPMAGGKIFRAR